jgi:putative membrane-bound dehydrogenase-like protein
MNSFRLLTARWVFAAAWFGVSVGAAFGAAEPEVTAKDLPRLPATEPANALSTFQVKKGFHLELVAAEPLVMSPIAMSFDENGRLFVVEMRDYSERRDERLGRIRMLEDTNHDGIFDKATVYAKDLPWPTAVICYGGGVLVASTPDILWLKDTNGDGAADLREVIFTGFGSGVERLNVQALLNSFNWGLDNRIHGATAPNGGVIKTVLSPDLAPLDLRSRGFSIEPRKFTMRAENGGGQYGLSFDHRGRKFVCSNSHHIQTYMYDGRYGNMNKNFPMPSPLVDIAVDGPAAEVYRLSPEEAWRVIRTQWRVTGAVGGPIEGGGRASGYFTGATGATIYRGNAFPQSFVGDAFIGDAGGNLVHHKSIRMDGVKVVAERPPDEQKSEFVASRDIWFRPVQFANAPDGALYIADMYREVIEHPWSLPESIKKFLDLNSGNDRGRIYRIVPDGFQQPAAPRLGAATTAELVATLEHSNGWHRDTAARLLYEKQDATAVPLLVRLARTSKPFYGRLHALYTLEGLNALAPDVVRRSLDDADPTVREHAVLLCEGLKARQGSLPEDLLRKLRKMAADPAITVRYQLAFTLGWIQHPDRVEALAEIMARDAGDEWIRMAALNSIGDAAAAKAFFAVAQDNAMRTSPGGREYMRQLMLLVGAGNRASDLAVVLDYLAGNVSAPLSFTLVRALGDGLQRAGVSFSRVEGTAKLGVVFEQARSMLRANQGEEPVRVQAAQLLALTTFPESGEVLLGLLGRGQPEAIQLAAIGTLDRLFGPQVAPGLAKNWKGLTPRARADAAAALLKRPDRALVLLEGIEKGDVRVGDLSASDMRALQAFRDPAVKKKAASVFGSAGGAKRQDVVNAFLPALSLKGDAARGKKVYEERCISCHRVAGQGFALGPDLESVKNTGKDKLLVNILDPNREVAPQFLAHQVETRDNESVIGIIGNETESAVTLRQAFGKDSVVPRSNISSMKSTGQSLMPEGLEAGLTPQGLADLIEFIIK